MTNSLSSIKSLDTNILSLDNPIYKVKQIVNGKIDTIYIFNGIITKSSEDELFNKIFSEKELEEIKSDNINIKFSQQKIHFDDSISTIKIKILFEIKKEISLEEIYLFCQKKETLNAVSIYQSLTQNNKLPLTKVRLDQFISNIIRDENGNTFQKPIEKEIYTFDDIFNMNFENKKYIVNKVLGQKFFIVDNEYPFVCDPYDVSKYDVFFEKSARQSLTTLNSHLLLNTGDIIENSIYLCLAEDVLSYLSRKETSEKTTLKIYYPFLYDKNINNLDDLNKNKNKLIENNKKIINKQTLESLKTIDMFYDIYYLRKSELNYINKGIKYIRALIKPNFDIKVPLETIFKIIHANKVNPLIKYNPSSRQENIYRLFTDKISTDGRKIPYLKKGSIFKLMKTIGRNKSVAVYIELPNNQTIICEFDENGYITITTEFKSVVSIDDIDTIFKENINPIITEIKNLLEQSGYKLDNFNSLKDKNVEIKQLTYETQISIKNPLDIQSYKGCISSIFINETNTFKGNQIKLRFKRVSNYSKFTSQEAFILEKSEQGLRGDQIIEALLENFSGDLDRANAIEMVAKVANELEIERGVRKSDIKIKNNPGFQTNIILDKETGIITITTENINNINYLYTLPIYLDSMVRLTQNKKSTEYSDVEIKKLCSSGEKNDVKIDDIISLSEESVSKSENNSIESNEEGVQYKKIDINKPKGALSLFFNDDEDEEEDEDVMKGGETDSEPSIESESSIESEKQTYNNITVPTGLSSPIIGSQDNEESIPSEKTPQPLESFGINSSEDSLPSESLSQKIETPESLSNLSENLTQSSREEKIPTLEPEKLTNSKERESEELEEKESQQEDKEDKEEVEPEQEAELDEEPEQEAELDEEPEQEEAEEEEKSEKGDISDEEEVEDSNVEVRNIDGMKLNKPYYFQNLIEKKDPILILKEDTPQFNSYTRTCSSNMRRQPVILTDSQLTKIKAEHPGFLREEDVIKYGSNPDNQFNYICPRYWCLKNNTLIDPKDLKEVIGKDGKKELIHPTCGKVLPKGDKKVKPGYYIYEFYKPKSDEIDYKKYPGLIPDSHPDGFCLPCCFDKYNTEGRIKAMKKCYDKEDKSINDEKEEKEGKNKSNQKELEEDEYIKGPEKFPLDPGRWGYLPNEIQIMLHEINADCQISKTNTNIKDNHPCLLRHGIEISKKQSFIACIADEIFFGKKIVDENKENKVAKILTLKATRERIIKAINVDSFIKYQNGNLVIDFYDVNKIADINKYTNTRLFTKLDLNKPEDKEYYTKVVSSYENFINFLKDDDAFIDHTYLWDIISMPNKYLFPNGVNIVIFQLPKDDITNNVQLLCPTNHYSNEFYDARKPTIIILKEDVYYEPIYSYTTNNKKISIIKEFKEYDPYLSKTLRAVFKEIIKPFFNLICKPLDSMPNIYKAKRPILLYDLVQKLDKYEYKIKKLVMNFNNKVIGIIAEEPNSDKTGFIPCYPSSLDEDLKQDLDFVFMNDITLWNTYTNTIQFLNKLDKRSKKRRDEPDIPCKPAFKIIEDEHVVGILTNTNQFIQISQPLRLEDIDKDLDIPSLSNDNYIININNKPMISSEIPISTEQEIDYERVDYIQKIRLENSFYNVFRNTIRILINNYENIKLREQIENEMSKEYIIYSEKLKNIDALLRELVKDKIQFIGDENYYKFINQVSTCIVKDKESCSSTTNLCVVTENGKCNLILPEKNLITNKNNETIYYGRMSDELIRYNRIKSFMLQPQVYLSFGEIGYNLKDDEIILIQSLLTQEYFDTLIPAVINKYTKNISYDEVEPIISQVYENTIPSLDHAIGRKNENICEKKINEKITSSIWKKCFPENYSEIEYSKYNFCTFNLIIDLIEKKTGSKLSINQIKNELFEEYKKYLVEYNDKIIDILILEGKKTLGDQVRAQTLTFANFLYTDNYFLTTFDLWLLVTKYKIPTIFISQKWILQAKYEKHEFVGYGDENDKFVFILIPGFRPENVPGYRLIQSNTGEIFISLDKLNKDCENDIHNSIKNSISINLYLQQFTKILKTNYEKKKPVKLVIESDDNEDKKDKKEIVKKKKLIVEESTPVIEEEYVIQPINKRKSRKKINVIGNTSTKKNKTNKKTNKIIIVDSTSSINN
jgi:hypothetical protein